MAENNTTMLQQFINTNALFQKHAQIECYIYIERYIRCEPMNHSSHFDLKFRKTLLPFFFSN